MDGSAIDVRGAREHNLRNVSLSIPRNQLIVVTGVSGSGKSSLAFDTLYAEGQRRYLESLSSYARQFIGQLPKPNVDYIGGLSPAISISQKSTSANPRSTVGTITEIYDFLRLLYARVGQGFCPICDVPITAQTRDQIIARLQALAANQEYLILASVIRGSRGQHRDLFDSLRRRGYARVRIDGTLCRLADVPPLSRQQKHDVEVVVGKFVPGQTPRTEIAQAVEEALRLGEGTMIVVPAIDEIEASSAQEAAELLQRTSSRPPIEDLIFSSEYSCPQCGESFLPPTPQSLSFNSPAGMCRTCEGLGHTFTFVPERIIPDPQLSLKNGAVEPLGRWQDLPRWNRQILLGVAAVLEEDYGLQPGMALAAPWNRLPAPLQRDWLFGLGERHITFTWRGGQNPVKFGGKFPGIIGQLEEKYRESGSKSLRKRLEKYMEQCACYACGGTRLGELARHLKLASSAPAAGERQWLNIAELCHLPIDKTLEFLKSLELDPLRRTIGEEVIREVCQRLQFLIDVGLDYLSLDRPAPTLSGGEAQRIRLASQIGAGLVGVLYVLDEPSIGLHPRDNDRLIDSLKALRDQGNTLLVVEHDEDTMRAADMVLDFGPGAGVRGGEIVGAGTLAEVAAAPRSLTGKYLSGAEQIAVPASRRRGNGQVLRVRGARHNNLKNIDVDIPLGKLVCVTGVSGSGKSSLVNEIIVPVLRRHFHRAEDVPGKHDRVEGLEHLDKVIPIDQSPIGRTPRSNPATYIKAFDEIRRLFASLPEAKRRGFAPGRFSFNVAGGRCEPCEGNGANKLEMDFLADIWVTCPVCNGQRYNYETLQVKFKEHSIADVLDLDVRAALELFENVPKIADRLQTLVDVGMDYIKLGQPSPTLSGGEAQRIKLARELSRRATGRTLYLLDEPTTGLHFHDIRLLINVLQDLVERGNTVLVIEHNLDVIKVADWIIDIGPEAGVRGGELVFAGTPEELLACAQSHTGRSLARHLEMPPVAPMVHDSKQKAKKTRRTKSRMVSRQIRVVGATEHNLKDVSLTIPHHALNVFCGPSGSGKSSMAMDTIYAEGQRRYVESLSSYARQFVGQMPKPHVHRIEGLAPAVAIEQKTVAHNPRSTVGTVTEIYDYLRVLMARLGIPHCPHCDLPVSTQTADDITRHLLEFPDGTRLVITAPLRWEAKMDPERMWEDLKTSGLVRVRVNGRTYHLDEPPVLSSTVSYQIEAVVDRVTVGPAAASRIAESVELALSLGGGELFVLHPRDDVEEHYWEATRHSQHLACRQCGHSLTALTPHSFSFNSPLGWCPGCDGLGVQTGTSPELLLDPDKTLAAGALRCWPPMHADAADWEPPELAGPLLTAFCQAAGIPMDVPAGELSAAQRRLLFHGAADRWFKVKNAKGIEFEFQWRGLFPAVEQAARLNYRLRAALNQFVGEITCTECEGSRLNRDAAAVRFRGKTMADYVHADLASLFAMVCDWRLDQREQEIAGELVREIRERLQFLLDVGLEYLTLGRSAATLSGGESQRIRLSSQLGSGLCGVLYVLDEPTIGLHPRDNHRLIGALRKLRDLGNTLIVVEHDRDVIEASDRVFDFGPAAGRYGGRLVAEGTPKQLARRRRTPTGPYLGDKQHIPIPRNRRTTDLGELVVRGARANNLKRLDVAIPLQRFCVVTGPSGSGKSSLVHDVLLPALARRPAAAAPSRPLWDAIEGAAAINKVICVDQSPIGSNPSSTPATYTGVYDLIRQLFASLPESRTLGLTARHFSFNVPGGRCEQCEGHGQRRIEMHFLPDIWVECDSCHGRRFTEEVLSITYHGYSIHDVLEMPISQAIEVFDNIAKIRRILQTLIDVGLDYVALGQSAPTLSGGEAQRVKLAAELSRPDTGRTLYLLDEPTTGLHFQDVAKLLDVLHRLVDLGNTVVVIEHNLDVIKSADWVIDMGPEAGDRGGRLVFAGTPEQLVDYAAGWQQREPCDPHHGTSDAGPWRSYTGEALIPVMARADYATRQTFQPTAVDDTREGDITIRAIAQATSAPWQADGRKWHLETSVSRDGSPIRWDRRLLARMVAEIEQIEGFAPTRWSHRSVVEITGSVKSRGWFFHAITAEPWLLKLKFRVPRRNFTKAELLRIVELPTLNEVDEIELYGNQPRVKAKASGKYLELEIRAFRLEEIDTPKFWKWLHHAANAFLGRAGHQEEASESSAKLAPQEHTPWKLLKQRWHMLRKGFPDGQEPQWPAETLSVLVQSVHVAAPAGRWRWDQRDHACYFLEGATDPWLIVFTKQPEALVVTLRGAPGFAERYDRPLPACAEVHQLDPTTEEIRLPFREINQPRSPSVIHLLKEHAQQAHIAAADKS
ncbi:MAG: UvrABC system protein A [Pirellulaceae bacterium]|nr:MAG: UvrABC system protein A [Pirellulaceae bacterium]